MSDLDVAIAVLVLSIPLGMRPSDVAQLEAHVRAKFPTGADSILRAFRKSDTLMRG